jgi:molecular chaperone GrpE
VPEPTLTELALTALTDKVDDVTRLLSRQASTLAAISTATDRTAAPDLPLLVELHALRNDALRCAATARSRRERAAFEAIAAGMERLLVGRGGDLVAPVAGEPFSGTLMEAVEVVATDDPTRDRAVAAVLEPGLAVRGRSVRPARVAVYRHRPAAPGA